MLFRIPALLAERDDGDDDREGADDRHGQAEQPQEPGSVRQAGAAGRSLSTADEKKLVRTLGILENVGHHPAADRLMLNLIHHAAGTTQTPLAPLPQDFAERLTVIGF